MLSKEQSFFLTVLSDCLNGRKTTVPEGLDEALLLSVSNQQQCAGIVYYQTQLPLFQNVSAYNACSYINRANALKAIDLLFAENEIPYFIFKGTEIAEFYPTPQMRTMGDSDILVHEQDRERAHQLLLDMGMKNQCKGENEWIYRYNGMEYELHCRLMNEGDVGSCRSHKDFMNRRWDYAIREENSVRYHLDPSYHFVFLLLHLRKHFMNSGVGFRQFTDISFMIQKCSLDWAWITAELEKMQLTPFAKICFAFCEKWFDISVPIDCSALDYDFYIETTEKIFKNGVFGFSDKDNQRNYETLQNQKYGKAGNVLRFIFPPYDTLKENRKFAFLAGKKYLLPAAWLYRFIRLIFCGSLSKCISHIKNKLNVTDEQTQARMKFLDQWGLT